MYSEYKKFKSELESIICPDKSFDIIDRKLLIAGRQAVLYFIDGFIKDEVFEKMLEYLFAQTPETLSGIDDMSRFAKDKMPYVEVDFTYDAEAAADTLLCGPAILIVEGIRGALIIDTRTYPVRGIEEPQKDRSLRGSRDGFVETIIFNTAMLRRRIRTPKLRMEYYQIGSRSKVDVAVSYIEGLADEKTLNILRKRLKSIDLKNISMTQQALSEALIKHSIFNPFPKFKFTERPDYASAAILDGRIALVMDNSPTVMLLPDSLADFFREADDYYFLPAIGTYTRILRMAVTFFTLLATPLYLLFMNNPNLVPDFLSFIKNADTGDVPLFVQFFILELVVDGLRLASINTPDTLSNSLGIIGGLLLSEFAVSAGWFVGEAILFMAFVTISSYSQPSLEMGYAIKFERVFLLFAVQLFGLSGLIIGIILCIIAMLCNKTFSGKGFLYPVIPFDARAFIRLFSRPGIGEKH